MLRDLSRAKGERQDIRAIGLIMIRLMEFKTSLQNPNSLVLQQPEKWNGDIKEFLIKTDSSSSEDLEKVTGKTLDHQRS